jgi:hypothetical protein
LAPRKWREGSLIRMIKDPLAGREERSDSEFQCDRRLPASLLRFNVLGAFLQLASEKGRWPLGTKCAALLTFRKLMSPAQSTPVQHTATSFISQQHQAAGCGEERIARYRMPRIAQDQRGSSLPSKREFPQASEAQGRARRWSQLITSWELRSPSVFFSFPDRWMSVHARRACVRAAAVRQKVSSCVRTQPCLSQKLFSTANWVPFLGFYSCCVTAAVHTLRANNQRNVVGTVLESCCDRIGE